MCDIKVTFHHKIFGHQLFEERDRFPFLIFRLAYRRIRGQGEGQPFMPAVANSFT